MAMPLYSHSLYDMINGIFINSNRIKYENKPGTGKVVIKYTMKPVYHKHLIHNPACFVFQFKDQDLEIVLSTKTLDDIYIDLARYVSKHPESKPRLMSIKQHYASLCKCAADSVNKATKSDIKFDKNCMRIVFPYDSKFTHFKKALQNMCILSDVFASGMFRPLMLKSGEIKPARHE